MVRRTGRPVLITDAQRSQEDQLRTREIRYVVMMGIRVVCLFAAVALISFQPPLLWLWLLLCAAGMAILPWVAVVLANDRLPKERHRWRRHRQPEAGFARQLPRGAAVTIEPTGEPHRADQ